MFGPMGTIRGWIGLKDDSLKMLKQKNEDQNLYQNIIPGYCKLL